MLQTTQTFSDITAIDTSLQLVVELELKTYDAEYTAQLNGVSIVAPSTRFLFDLFSPINFSIELTSGRLEIAKLIINDLEVLPLYLNQAIPQTSFLDKPTNWQFRIDQPFYQWYHTISGQGFIA